jgi:hypothetical protein
MLGDDVMAGAYIATVHTARQHEREVIELEAADRIAMRLEEGARRRVVEFQLGEFAEPVSESALDPRPEPASSPKLADVRP